MSTPFDDIFQALRVKGVVYYAHAFYSPWAMRFAPTEYLRFHLVLRGACSVDIGGERLAMGENALLLLPGGAGHTVSDGREASLRDAMRDAREVGAAIRAAAPGEAPAPEGRQPAARLVSGHFALDPVASRLLLAALPAQVLTTLRDEGNGGLVDALPAFLANEISLRLPGSATIVERLAEVFLVQVLRAHFRRSGSGDGLLSALFDPRLNAALALMHARWNEPLTLAAIAAAAGMSRSSFAQKFKQAAGIGPMAHLASWRLLKARDLLADRSRSVAQVAAACGHRSTEGFSRAFKRAYHLSPAQWRARHA